MWTLDDLKRAVERRNEHLVLAPEVERVILAAERATGRTEEAVSRDTAKGHLRNLLQVLKAEVPDPIRAAYPVFPAASMKAPTAMVVPPRPLPAHAFDKDALIAELKIAEAGARAAAPAEPGAPRKVISLEPQAAKDKARSSGGPSR